MPKYDVYVRGWAHRYCGQIEASNKKEAEELAWKELDVDVSLCHQCSREFVDTPELQEMELEEVDE